MDAPILNQLRDRQFGHLHSHRIEAGQNNGSRGLVDDKIDACDALEGAVPPALPGQ